MEGGQSLGVHEAVPPLAGVLATATGEGQQPVLQGRGGQHHGHCSVTIAHYHHTCSPPRVPPHTGPWSPAGVTVPGLQSAPAHCSYIGRISPPHPWPSGPPSSLWRPACSLQCCSAAVICLCKYRRLNHCNPLSVGHSDTVCMRREVQCEYLGQLYQCEYLVGQLYQCDQLYPNCISVTM